MTDWLDALARVDSTEPDEPALTGLSRSAGAALEARGLYCGTAESCTGGMVATLLTDIAGSSGWFDRGYVTYSNQAKHEMLGVPLELIESVGAVSQEVVLAMVAGVIERGGVQIATAISGVAGPGGGSPDKPVGTVWIAWAHSNKFRHAARYQFDGDRGRIRRLAARQVLHGIILCASTV